MEEAGIRGELRRGLLRKNPSSLVAIWAEPYLLLDQVNLPLVGFMSKRSQEEEKYSIISLQGSQTILPPIFSLLHRMVLKSPATIIFDPLTSSESDRRDFRH
jgi:hypothetical protein